MVFSRLRRVIESISASPKGRICSTGVSQRSRAYTATADRYGRYAGGSVKVVDRSLTVNSMPSGGPKNSAWVTACGRSLEMSNHE